VSLIGNLDQLNLALVLQGIESYAKTGLLVIKQEEQWVELYFRDGRLMCIGPMRVNATLGDRLLQAGVISPSALQDVFFAAGTVQPGETRIALTLMDLGHVSHESLRAWAMKEASAVISVLLTWQSGELFFEDGLQPPADRLLVALSPAALLPATPPIAVTPQSPQKTQIETTSPVIQGLQRPVAPSDPHPATLLSVSQLIAETPSVFSSASSSEASLSPLNMFSDSDAYALPPLTPPMRVTAPLAPIHIDSAFFYSLRPEMVMIPVDLSSLRQQNPQLQLTPEQWRVLTRADGRTSLQSACQELGMSSDSISQVVGELVVLGLIQISLPLQSPAKELSPVSRELIMAGLANGYVAPGSAASTAQPWMAITPTTDAFSPSFGSSFPFETKSQWGNGGNGATFVPGQGWIANPQPMQPLQAGGPLYTTNGAYA
jgi:hypothetical protein